MPTAPPSPQYRAAVRRLRRGAAISAVLAALSFLALRLLVPRTSEPWRHTVLSLVVVILALAVWGVFAFTILWIVSAWEGKRDQGHRR